MTKRHQNRITEPLIDSINKLAIETDAEPTEICQFIVNKYKLEEYSCPVLPTITAAAIICDSKLGREAYTRQRKMLLANNNKSFPTWKEVTDLRDKITPTLITLEQPLVGVMCTLTEAASITINRILKLEAFSPTNQSETPGH